MYEVLGVKPEPWTATLEPLWRSNAIVFGENVVTCIPVIGPVHVACNVWASSAFADAKATSPPTDAETFRRRPDQEYETCEASSVVTSRTELRSVDRMPLPRSTTVPS